MLREFSNSDAAPKYILGPLIGRHYLICGKSQWNTYDQKIYFWAQLFKASLA